MTPPDEQQQASAPDGEAEHAARQETPAEQTAPRKETTAERRRRLEAVFGDVLPDTTRDEREDSGGASDDSVDAWLRDQVPPHHG